MKQIEWQIDQNTAYWAKRISLPASVDYAPQYAGDNKRMYLGSWQVYIENQEFPLYCRHQDEGYVTPSPANIIQCFQENYFLEGLVLSIGWGNMARTNKYIYGESPNLEKLQTTLSLCKENIELHGDIKAAWELMTGNLEGNLRWGQVITSKVLHFLTRSCGYEQNPPVPFDNAVTWNQVSAWFFTTIALQKQEQDRPMPETWWDNNHSWESYNRYMTAIICWANYRGWTTTDLETSLFKKLLLDDNATSISPETDNSK